MNPQHSSCPCLGSVHVFTQYTYERVNAFYNHCAEANKCRLLYHRLLNRHGRIFESIPFKKFIPLWLFRWVASVSSMPGSPSSIPKQVQFIRGLLKSRPKSISRRLYPPGRDVSFNRMNGSPGDPPGSPMHSPINQRIVPQLTRLAGDPIGKEAVREINIFSRISVVGFSTTGTDLGTDARDCKLTTVPK